MAEVWAQRAVAAASAAIGTLGLDADGAQLLRVGENAVVRFPAAGVLAKVTSGPAEGVGRELAVARWLAAADLPAVRPAAAQPVEVDGCVVSLWDYLPEAKSADVVTLARCLRRLHAVAIPEQPQLTPVRPFARLEARLATASTLTDDDRAFLLELRDQLSAQWRQARFAQPPVVVHGDAHMDNLLVAGDGQLAFVDLENVAVGPLEWDLTLTALYHECGWYTADQYASFAETYGADVRQSPSWPVLRGIRMLRMTTWLAYTAADYPERNAQLRHRLATLRDGTAPTGWTGY